MPIIIKIIKFIVDLFFLPFVIIFSFIARFKNKSIDIGLGPEPLINNIFHKKALKLYGYSAETFVNSVYYITDDFDIRADLIFKGLFKAIINHYLFLYSIFKYKCIYIYFNGGPLGFTSFLWKIEPFLYKIAKVKTVVMPYGGDVQEMSRSHNLLFKHVMSKDYPRHKFRRKLIEKKIDLWSRYATHIIGGCEWVDYMYYWDTLMLAHFSIDTNEWKMESNYVIPNKYTKERPLRVLHAPNHKEIKGTKYFIRAIDELKAEGYPIELILVEKIPNYQIKEIMKEVDVIADQLIVGWYAMFAIESMSMGKLVLCYIREDLEEFYTASGLLEKNELPLIKCSPLNIKEVLTRILDNAEELRIYENKSKNYVAKHHSIQSVGLVFDYINTSIGIKKSSKENEIMRN
jgi:glycosyltransferase involved in cell wall biosynthesis